jgi:uncharacterized protein (TIGR03083 family)
VADSAEGHIRSPVAGCPGWDVGDVVAHLGGVYGWAASVVQAAGARPDVQDSPPERSALLAWFAERREELLRTLAGHGPEDPAWVFISSSPQNVGWWAHRQAFETTVHRFDVEAAAGCPPAEIDPALAVEGIDEFLTQFLPRVLGRSPVEGLQGTFHVHCTDAEGEWSLDFAEATLTRREHSKADTAVRGPASGLYLWMWNRLTAEQAGVEVFGDTSVVDSWSQVRQ